MPKIDLKTNERMAKVVLHSIPDRPGIAAEIFSAMGEQGIGVELMSSVATGRNKGDVSFAVLETDLKQVGPILEDLKRKLGAKKTATVADVSLISLYGEGLSTDPGLSSRVFKALAGQGINLQMISQSVNALSFLVERSTLERAVTLLKATGEVE